MTNRQKLLGHSEYDTLVKMNENLLAPGSNPYQCIVEVLEGHSIWPCPHETCEECIQKWLNEEVN